MLKPNVPAWFEIPAADLARAQRFYEHVTEAVLVREAQGEVEIAAFPHAAPYPSGALVRSAGRTPSATGSIVYLHLDDIAPALARARGVGATVLVPRTALPGGRGWFAQLIDSEGNRVGLYSPV